jgi:alkyl hydroperoxide reductase subunit F
MQKFEAQIRQFPVEIKNGFAVMSLAQIKNGFAVKTAEEEEFQAKTVIIATGKKPRPLNVPGEEMLRGRGVTYCAICDGPLFAGENVAVIGGGNSALEAADDLIKIASHVYLISRSSLTGDAVIIERVKGAPNLTILLNYQPTAVGGTARVENISVKNLKTGEQQDLTVSGIFVEIGLIPNSDLVREIVPLNELGEIKVNCANGTEVPGLFAAGDVTDVPEKQIIVSAGEGAKAALQAHRYLQRLNEAS